MARVADDDVVLATPTKSWWNFYVYNNSSNYERHLSWATMLIY